MNGQSFQIRRSVAAFALAVALVAGGGLVWTFASSEHPVFSAARAVTFSVAPSPQGGQGGTGSWAEGFAGTVEPLLPAVVNISTKRMVQQSRQQAPSQDDPLFRRFFGDQFGNGNNDQPRERDERSLGSGVIVSPDGYILTNNHVIEGATDIQVFLKDKRQLKAKLVGADPRTDLAVLQIPATGLASVKLGDSTKLRVGDIVLAIGDPFGIGETVTMGIVSATGRRSPELAGSDGGYADFIQTDAAINPGNSGGALVNARGELVGINAAIISGSGGNQGIGFAIPVNMARGVMEQILKNGKVTRGYLGVIIQPVTPELAKAFALPSVDGALIGDVTPNSPGAKAGLLKGDVVVALDGHVVPEYEDLRLQVSQMAPGTTVKLDVLRAGQKRQLSVTLGELPETTNAKAATPDAPGDDAVQGLGLQLSALTADIAQQLNLPAGIRGVVVSNVDPDGVAAEAGLQRGDLIQEVNRKPVASVDQFRAAVRDAGSQPLLLLINRAGTTNYTVISPQ
jgi:serine protease Do